MTCLFLADVMQLEDPAVYDMLYAGASSFRRASADAFRFDGDRRLSLGATALLDHGLRRLGLREREMSYGRTENGKPFFSNAPEIHFSISHSGSKVAVAFSDSEVGCDIERIVDIDMTVAERFFCRDEYKSLMDISDSVERLGMFFKIWTRKESYMKALGLGFALPPESFSVVSGENSDFSFLEPDSFSGYACTLCHRRGSVPQVEHVLSLTGV